MGNRVPNSISDKGSIHSPFHPDTVRTAPDYSPDNINHMALMRAVFVASIKEYCELSAKLETLDEAAAFAQKEVATWLHGPDFDFFCDLFNLDPERHRQMVIEEPEAILVRMKECK